MVGWLKTFDCLATWIFSKLSPNQITKDTKSFQNVYNSKQNYFMDIKEKFGQRVKTLRKEKGMSQEELAEKSGLNRPYISAIEQGKRNVSLEVMEKLAEAMGVGIVSLIADL